ncbi:glycoside hydrolase family 65 protein [Herbiconiux sp. VKM Ac-1786]|uniref:glycoside hydrolase family 65 protein n=1 Tax=Herbiconiux sp. VKM Ac-1786 TaxID=2783824 RepID=UPI00188B2737|nr:glycoside hydrolase family 65 protein [Herbiconiux sp. VKM Ac-1786]MBF4574513.1 glycoside hydrolase family 65 protein [Herbiconiux sp. VKM Ac-1786]
MGLLDYLDHRQFPIEEWALVESSVNTAIEGRTETLFAIGNGYFGMRGAPEEGRGGHQNGTFINGFHDTWTIRHAEEAFGFARVGQTIVNVPDAKVIELYVDDEPFDVATAEILRYHRRLDFNDGVLSREIEWRTSSGKRVLVRTQRLVSFTDRHLAVVTYTVTMLDAPGTVLLSSQILNRQDWKDEYATAAHAEALLEDPRQAAAFSRRVLEPRLKHADGPRQLLGYQAANSGMTLAVGVDHGLQTENVWTERGEIEDDQAKHLFKVQARAGTPIELTKTITYHSANGVPVRELADRCNRTLDRINARPIQDVFSRQKHWLADFWDRADVAVDGQPEMQQAIRWNLYQLAQSTARTDGGGIAAKGVSGSGYGGHYFWDTEIYVLPFLTYTSPHVARNALRFRQNMLPAARERAAELNQRGALFPWRTISGLESSAYYAAGTAQYHIDADISHALMQYVSATGDIDFLNRGAIDILIETARMWADLGFWRRPGAGPQTFHIHGVTGPDEYTTVVNDNLYTNVMARANLQAAVRQVRRLREECPEAYASMVQRVDLDDDEIQEWEAAAEAMHIPFDEDLGIHPQDAQFLEKELWDLENTPASKRPLLLHFHPLVIYRFQVIKQADVVLAMFLRGSEFSAEQKRANFEYYDALTTGDSTLSASTQSIIAAEVGYRDLALDYFRAALFVDLGDLHHNTADGVHVASTGGVWSALVFGFGGMRDHAGSLSFDPRLPEGWESLTFRITTRGSRMRVQIRQGSVSFALEDGAEVKLRVRAEAITVYPGMPAEVSLQDDRPDLQGAPTTSDIEGTHRGDGSVITASIPTITLHEDQIQHAN